MARAVGKNEKKVGNKIVKKDPKKQKAAKLAAAKSTKGRSMSAAHRAKIKKAYWERQRTGLKKDGTKAKKTGPTGKGKGTQTTTLQKWKQMKAKRDAAKANKKPSKPKAAKPAAKAAKPAAKKPAAKAAKPAAKAPAKAAKKPAAKAKAAAPKAAKPAAKAPKAKGAKPAAKPAKAPAKKAAKPAKGKKAKGRGM